LASTIKYRSDTQLILKMGPSEILKKGNIKSGGKHKTKMSISWHINYPAEYSLRLYCIFWVRECPRVLCQRWRLLLTNLIADVVRHRLLYYNLARVCAFWVLGNRNQTLIINNKNVSICETFRSRWCCDKKLKFELYQALSTFHSSDWAECELWLEIVTYLVSSTRRFTEWTASLEIPDSAWHSSMGRSV